MLTERNIKSDVNVCLRSKPLLRQPISQKDNFCDISSKILWFNSVKMHEMYLECSLLASLKPGSVKAAEALVVTMNNLNQSPLSWTEAENVLL